MSNKSFPRTFHDVDQDKVLSQKQFESNKFAYTLDSKVIVDALPLLEMMQELAATKRQLAQLQEKHDLLLAVRTTQLQAAYNHLDYVKLDTKI